MSIKNAFNSRPGNFSSPINQSMGILDDFAIRKDLQTISLTAQGMNLNGNLSMTGNIGDISNHIGTIYATGLGVYGNASIANFVSNLVPLTDKGWSIGNATHRWNNGFIENVYTNLSLNQIPYSSSSGLLQGTSTFTFDGSLTIVPDLQITSNSTPGSICYINASGNIAGINSDLGWDYTNKRLGIGTSSPSGDLEIDTTSTASNMFMKGHGATAAGGGIFRFQFSRGTKTSPTIVSNGDQSGVFVYQGYDGNSYQTMAKIGANVDGTTGSSVMPGCLIFYTTPTGSATATEKMRIDNQGKVGIGITPTQSLEVNGNISGSKLFLQAGAYNSLSITFGDSDTGIYGNGNNLLDVVIGGSRQMEWAANFITFAGNNVKIDYNLTATGYDTISSYISSFNKWLAFERGIKVWCYYDLKVSGAGYFAGVVSGSSLYAGNGATGTFTSADLKTITITNGIVTSIV